MHDFGDSELTALAIPEAQLCSLLAFIANHVEDISMEDIAKSNLGIKLKWLTRHPLDGISRHALDLHSALKARHRSLQAVKRARLAVD